VCSVDLFCSVNVVLFSVGFSFFLSFLFSFFSFFLNWFIFFLLSADMNTLRYFFNLGVEVSISTFIL